MEAQILQRWRQFISEHGDILLRPTWEGVQLAQSTNHVRARGAPSRNVEKEIHRLRSEAKEARNLEWRRWRIRKLDTSHPDEPPRKARNTNARAATNPAVRSTVDAVLTFLEKSGGVLPRVRSEDAGESALALSYKRLKARCSAPIDRGIYPCQKQLAEVDVDCWSH